MHNGVLDDLGDVMRFYDQGRSQNPNVTQVDPEFVAVGNLNNQERNDITAFLRALTSDDFDDTIPATVPSGLPPGGSIR